MVEVVCFSTIQVVKERMCSHIELSCIKKKDHQNLYINPKRVVILYVIFM